MKTMRNFLMELSGVPESFNNIRFDGGHFAGSCASYNNCEIISGVIERGIFNNCDIYDVDLAFTSATFNNCTFRKCTGTNHLQYAKMNNCDFINCVGEYLGEGEDYDDDYDCEPVEDYGTYSGHYVEEDNNNYNGGNGMFNNGICINGVNIIAKYNVIRGFKLVQSQFVKNTATKLVYESIDGSNERITLDKDDLYIKGIALSDYYDDDYEFESALRLRVMKKQDGFQESYENFRAYLSKSAKQLKERPDDKYAKYADEIEYAIESGKFAKVEEQANKIVEQLLDNKAKHKAERQAKVESKPVKTNESNNANPVVAKLQELMVKALEEGDFDAYDKLEERLNRISK